MSIYTQNQSKHTFSGEIESAKDVVLIDELTCEDLPFKVVRRELNREFLFCSTRTLTEYLTNLNED
jgi:hypothetical protein